MTAKDIQHGWLTVSEAARYAQISRDEISAAIDRKELRAYKKPVRERTGTTRQNVMWRTKEEFVDAYICGNWECNLG